MAACYHGKAQVQIHRALKIDKMARLLWTVQFDSCTYVHSCVTHREVGTVGEMG